MARQLDGYGRCTGCGENYAACAGVYYCDDCEEDPVVEADDEQIDEPPRQLTCGCCTAGCICWCHQDRRIGHAPTICEYHSGAKRDHAAS